MPGELAHAVTKAALDALTVSLSAELADRDITVNAVDPGPTDTGWMAAGVKAALDGIADRHRGVAQDTARVVAALVNEAAAHVAGQIVRVRPGGTALSEPGLTTTSISKSRGHSLPVTNRRCVAAS